MQLKLEELTELQQDLLRAALASGGLTHARGGYITAPGAKPFSVRTVMALQRYGLLTLSDGTHRAAITTNGSRLLLCGQVELAEEQAG
jgi:hypothetical protein